MFINSRKMLFVFALSLASGAHICAMQSQEEKDALGKALAKRAKSGGDIGEFKNLIARGANVDFKDRFKYAPLHHAAEKGRLDMVNELIAHGANLHVQQAMDYTALMLAAGRGHENVVAALIKAGADIYMSSKHGHTALFETISVGNVSPSELHARANVARMILGKATELTRDDKAAIKTWLMVNQRLRQEGGPFLPKDPRMIVAKKVYESYYESFPGLLRERVVQAGALEALRMLNWQPNPEFAKVIEQYLNPEFLRQRVREQLPNIDAALSNWQAK